jgi:hypothetical protein
VGVGEAVGTGVGLGVGPGEELLTLPQPHEIIP